MSDHGISTGTDAEGRAALKIVYALVGALAGHDAALDGRLRNALDSLIETDAAVQETEGNGALMDEVTMIIRLMRADLIGHEAK